MESGVRPFGSPKDKKDELARFSARGALMASRLQFGDD